LVVVRIITRDVVQIPELLLRFLPIGLERFSPRSFMEGDAAVR
jgi:hypothetical protein